MFRSAAIYCLLLLLYAAYSLQIESCLEAKEINPNLFTVPGNYSLSKLASSAWHEHFVWTLSTNNSNIENDTWTSYFMQFTLLQNRSIYAEFSAGGKPKTKCVYSSGALLTYDHGKPKNSVANLNMRTVTSSGRTFDSSTWLLDETEDPFFAMIQCDSFCEDWHNYSPDLCPAWRASLYYKDCTQRSNAEYMAAKASIEQKICFPMEMMREFNTWPSSDCIRADTTTSRAMETTTNGSVPKTLFLWPLFVVGVLVKDML